MVGQQLAHFYYSGGAPDLTPPHSYELHVSPAFHRCGLGRKLTQMLFDICNQRGLDKVMLTAFKGIICHNYSFSDAYRLLDPPKLTKLRPCFMKASGMFIVCWTLPKAALIASVLSFVLDPSSPGYGASLPIDDEDDDWEDEGGGYVDEECDYMILSKSVVSGTH